ncbi:MAG: substrate-binding domain-containing protein [Peptococcaceae bacterium]|nr:substrate-binding domain-containing protein [Peptococcaceae bacterium]
MRKNKKLISVLLICAVAMMFLAGCGAAQEEQQPVEPKGTIILATTTSTQDSGLLDYLLPAFTAETGWEVSTIAVGTGKALQMGVDGEADVLLVHARASEDEFMANGDGTLRYDVMYNDYVLVGPAADPAGVKACENVVADSMAAIANAQAEFISRGDDSGTHKKELNIWKAAAIEPAGEWYVSAGAGMGDVLKMADEKQAYTITDRATYLSMVDTLDLEIVCEKDTDMLNPYGVITVNPEKNDQINEEGAKAFADWLVSENGQKMIGEFGVEEFGSPLFTPDAK